LRSVALIQSPSRFTLLPPTEANYILQSDISILVKGDIITLGLHLI
jgi:hypothetical protein